MTYGVTLTLGNSDIEFCNKRGLWTLGNTEDSDIEPEAMVRIPRATPSWDNTLMGALHLS